MNCPSCLTAVPDGAAICDNCDHILDTSFLGEDITNDEVREDAEQATRIKAVPPPVEDATRIKAAPAKVAKAAPAKAKGRASPLQAAPAAPLYAEDDDESTASGRARASLDELAAPPSSTNEALEDLAAQFKALPRSERISAVGVGLLLLSLGLPWKNTRDNGEFIGFVSGAWPIALLALVVGAAIVFRRHPKVKPHKPRVLLASIGAAVLAGVGCIVFLRTNLEHVTLRAGGRLIRQNVVWPDFGAYVGLAAAMVILGGAIKTWMDRDSLPE